LVKVNPQEPRQTPSDHDPADKLAYIRADELAYVLEHGSEASREAYLQRLQQQAEAKLEARRLNLEQRADQDIQNAERAIERAITWLEQAKQERARGKPQSAYIAAGRAKRVAYLTHPVEIPREAPPGFIELAELLNRRAEQLKVIDDMPQAAEEHIYLKLILGSLTEFISTAMYIRRQIVVELVNQGNISRVEAGRVLGVHQSTIAQWVKEDTPLAASDFPQIKYPCPKLHFRV
jgi:hypothetical protein